MAGFFSPLKVVGRGGEGVFYRLVGCENFALTDFSKVRAAFRQVRSCLHGGKDDPLGKRGRKEHQICLRLYAITRRILPPSTRWFGGCRKTLCPSSGTCGGLSPTSS